MPHTLRLPNRDEPVEFFTIGELAKLCGRSKSAFKGLIRRGIMPEANFKTPEILIKNGARKGEYKEGYRLYSKEFLAPRIMDFMSSIKQGNKITLEQRSELMTLFEQERDKFLNT